MTSDPAPAAPADPSTTGPAGAPAPEARPATGLICFARVARHHGSDLSIQRLIHDNALPPGEPDPQTLARVAGDSGFRARPVTLTWRDLAGLGEAFPAMARLNNGQWVILSGFAADRPDGAAAVIMDPLAQARGFLFVTEAEFTKGWSGEVLLLKKVWKLTDPDQPFGLGWFVPELLRQGRLLRDVAVAVVLLHLLGLSVPIFFQLVIDKVLVHEGIATLYVLGIGVCAAIVFEAIFSFIRRLVLLYVANRIDIRVATRTFGHMLRLPMDFFERAPAGVLVKHMQQAQRVREFLTGQLFVTLLEATALLVLVPILLMYSVPLTVVVLVFTAAISAVMAALVRPFRRRLRALYEAEGERQALLVEAIHGMRTLKSLTLEPQQQKAWNSRTARAIDMHFRVGWISATAQEVTRGLERLLTVAIIAIGSQLVFDGALTVGALVAFNMLAGRVLGPLSQMVGLVHQYQEAALSVRMLGTVMNHPAERAQQARGITIPIRGRVTFEDVTFRYAPEAAPALDQVSFDIPAESIFGVVGRSGSGKTTITRLMQGMHTAQGGVVRLDGRDVRELDLVHLRTSTGIVLQDNFLFRGTIRENIAAARPSVPFEDVVGAAELAGATEFIERLPRGFDTDLEENAANLSGGQRQRLAIARALITRPRLLIFDEATSALDPDSEAILMQNLRRIAAGRTLIIVSHRLATMVDADRILVLDRGRVAGLGTHGELTRGNDIYRHLWQQQTRVQA